MVIYIIYLLAGVFIGVIITVLVFAMYHRSIIFGYLKMQDNDDGDPYLFMDLDKHPNELVNKKWVMFHVPRK